MNKITSDLTSIKELSELKRFTKFGPVESEIFFLDALEIQSDNELNNRHYGCFLLIKKQDNVQSEKYYNKADSIKLKNFIKN